MDDEYGVKMSMVGEDVFSANDNKLILNTKYPSLKIHSEGSGSHYIEGDDRTGFTKVITTHNLVYSPMFLMQANIGDGYELLPFGDYRGTFSLSFFASSKGEDAVYYPKTLVLGMTAVSTHNELWGESAVLPDPFTISYSWVIFYDPTNE
jgi:hypothetical protein